MICNGWVESGSLGSGKQCLISFNRVQVIGTVLDTIEPGIYFGIDPGRIKNILYIAEATIALGFVRRGMDTTFTNIECIKTITPVKQDRYGKDNGNCMQACLASMMGVALHKVPDFNLWVGVFGHWVTAAQAWMAQNNYILSGCWQPDFALSHIIRADEIVIAGGHNPDGVGHAVLYQNGVMLHDPNPSDAGIVEVEFYMTLRRIKKTVMAKAVEAYAK